MTSPTLNALIDALKELLQTCKKPSDVDKLTISELNQLLSVIQIDWLHIANRRVGVSGVRGRIITPTKEFCDRHNIESGTVIQIFEQKHGANYPTLKIVFTGQAAKK